MKRKEQNKIMDKKIKKNSESKALVLSSVELNQRQISEIKMATPVDFVRERRGRGGKMVKYVEGGYVIAKLNQIFGNVNWSFEEVDIVESEKEVSVLGRLTIHDHRGGYSVKKEQWGQSDIQDNVPLGDTRKAAATDALKKCASLYGVALDVYWNQLDRSEKKPEEKVVKAPTITRAEALKRGIAEIVKEKDPTILRQMREKIEQSTFFKAEEKENLINKINAKLG